MEQYKKGAIREPDETADKLYDREGYSAAIDVWRGDWDCYFYSKIVVYGETEEEAVSLRDEILHGLIG